MPKPAKLARPARNVRRHTGATLCGAVYFNLPEDLSFYGGFEREV